MKHGLCVGGPMDGQTLISSRDYYKFEIPTKEDYHLDEFSVCLETRKIAHYTKTFYTGGVYQWIFKNDH